MGRPKNSGFEVHATTRWTFFFLAAAAILGVFGPNLGIGAQRNPTNGSNTWRIRSDGEKKYVLMNGREYGPYDSVQEPVFSEDGSQWAFSFGNPQKRFRPQLTASAPAFFVFEPRLFRRFEGQFVNWKGRSLGPFEHVMEMGFSPRGLHFLYIEENEGLNRRGNYFWFVDGQVLPWDGTYFSPDFLLVAFTESKEGRRYVRFRDHLIGPFDWDWVNILLPNGGVDQIHGQDNLCFSYHKGNDEYVWFSGKTFGPFVKVGSMIYSSDGAHNAFSTVLDSKHRYIYLDGERIAWEYHDLPGRLEFRSDSTLDLYNDVFVSEPPLEYVSPGERRLRMFFKKDVRPSR
jgi:hypothetical protein